MSQEEIKISYSYWFSIPMMICCIFAILLFPIYIFWAIANDVVLERLWRIIFFSFFIMLCIWFLTRIVFYSVLASDDGLNSKSVIGESKFIAWEDIIEIRKPRLGIPYDAIYVITNEGEKVMLIRGMKDLDRMIETIKKKSPNLRTISI